MKQIDWGAGYSALEAIEHDLSARGVDGHARGWWTNKERENFKKTANSAEALGVLARHARWRRGAVHELQPRRAGTSAASRGTG